MEVSAMADDKTTRTDASPSEEALRKLQAQPAANGDRDEAELRRRIEGPRHARREVGEDERHDREHRECSKRGADAGPLETLLVMADRPAEQAETHQEIEDHHHRREHRIARERLRLFGFGLHQGQDQSDLDHRHREREDQCPERFADAVRDDLGMVDRRDDRAREDERDQPRIERHREARHRGNEAQYGEDVVGAVGEAQF